MSEAQGSMSQYAESYGERAMRIRQPRTAVVLLLIATAVLLPEAAFSQEKTCGPNRKPCRRVIQLKHASAPLDQPAGQAPLAPPANDIGLPSGPLNQRGKTTPAPNGEPGNQSTSQSAGSGLPAQVLQQQLGPEGFRDFQAHMLKTQQMLGNVSANQGCGMGSPCASVFFDQAERRKGNDGDEHERPAGTSIFQGRYNPITTEDAHKFVDVHGGIPGGGVVLEGADAGLDTLEEISYDPDYQALVLNGRAVYFIGIPPESFATLCRAIAENSDVGVSLGERHLVYGAVPKDSDLAYDMMLADRFLADIAFGLPRWTAGYRFANGYRPQANKSPLSQNVAVFFRFGGFRFDVRNQAVVLVDDRLDVTLVPLSANVAADGNLLPDYDAIRRGDMSAEFAANVQHIAENVSYYRKEPIVQRMYAYGAAATLIRWLWSEGADLDDLANQLDY